MKDAMRTIKAVTTEPPALLDVLWSDGTRAKIDIAPKLENRWFQSLHDAQEFPHVRIGEWGHSVEWPSGAEIAADTLWRETLTVIGRGDTRAFLEWRLFNGLSLTKAAEALGISRRMVAYYSNGEKPVPRAILLACKGWEVERAA